MDLNKIFLEITKKLDELNQDREDIIKLSREMIRNCSIAIKSIHRKEFDAYQEKIKKINNNHENLLKLINKNPLVFGRYLKTPEQEYIEAVCLYSIIQDQPLPTPEDYGINQVNYLLGLADVIGELRRYALDQIRQDKFENLEKILDIMDNIYTQIFSLDYPKSLTHELRHKTDVARNLIEKTRGDISLSVQINKLNKKIQD
jgi:translin